MTAASGSGLLAVEISPLRWWHLPQVLDLERASFAPEAWSAEMFWSELAQGASRHYLVALNGAGVVVGYGGLAVSIDEGYVQTLAVLPAARRLGLGALLLRLLLAAAVDRGCTRVLLEVRVDNAAAQALYRRAGFAPIGLRKGYYQPSNADALVMLCAEPAAGVAALAAAS